MNETLEYGIQKDNLSLSLPRNEFESLRRRSGHFASELHHVEHEGLLHVDRLGGPTRLTIDTEALGRLEQNDQVEHDDLRRTVGIFEKLALFGDERLPDPVLQNVRMDGTRLPGASEFGMRARLAMTLASDYHLQDVADWAMQTTARALNAVPEDRVESDVYSYVREKAGVSLKVNLGNGIRRLETDGSRYQFSNQREQDLEAAELYSHKAQLVCLAGLIAVARA